MKFIGLLSGGKDSCITIQECKLHGHELVCLANLYPPNEVNEMHSFMYQTAAHNVIPMLALCFDVPLYRREIKNTCTHHDLRYHDSKNSPETSTQSSLSELSDEVEDLYILLRDILIMHPDIQGISCGAILSNYQRFRVENVCNRLKLIPISYLWQISQNAIYNHIIDSDIHCILVKVAGVGLIPYKHLSKSLQEMKSTIAVLHSRYGLDICGEGGEYESLVIDMNIFKKYKVLLEETSITLDPEDESIGNLVIRKCSLQPKESAGGDVKKICDIDQDIDIIASHAKIDMTSVIEWRKRSYDIVSTYGGYPTIDTAPRSLSNTKIRFTIGLDGMIKSNILHGSDFVSLESSSDQQLSHVFDQLKESLTAINCELGDIVFVHLYLNDINDFGLVNTEYFKWFGELPPSRSCIQVRHRPKLCNIVVLNDGLSIILLVIIR